MTFLSKNAKIKAYKCEMNIPRSNVSPRFKHRQACVRDGNEFEVGFFWSSSETSWHNDQMVDCDFMESDKAYGATLYQ